MHPAILDSIAQWHENYAQMLFAHAQSNDTMRLERDKHVRWAKQLRREALKVDMTNAEVSA